MMRIEYLLIMAALAALCLACARRGNDAADKTEETGGNFEEMTTSDIERVICVYDMDSTHLQKTINDFLTMYSEDGDIERPSVSQENGVFKLTFSSALDYLHMCFWVNYLVYSDENQQQRFTVRGWYTFGEAQRKDEVMPFSHQTVMLYVDKADEAYDNISFVTPDGTHYLQPFAANKKFHSVVNGSETDLNLNR